MNYDESYVAFLDILGFKELINTSDFDEVLNLFKIITNVNSAEGCRLALRKTDDENVDSITKYNEALDKSSIYVMSDSIVVSVSTRYEMALDVVIDICNYIQVMLYDMKSPILLRGAVARGELYCNEAIAFGKGMVAAYVYQENYSIYSRIILSRALREEIITEEVKNKLYCDQKDSYFYIDSLNEYLGQKDKNAEECRKFRKLIDKYLDNYYSSQIRDKYKWLEKVYERVVDKVVFQEIGISSI